MTTEDARRWRVCIPADIDRPDPVAFGLTGRQLLITAPTALGLWAGFLALGGTVPPGALVAAGIPLAAVALVLALGQRDGLGLDAFALAAASWAAAPKHRSGALTPGRMALPRWAPRARREPSLAPLRLPVSAVEDTGLLRLDGRQVAVIACTSLNFHLSSPSEQEAAIGAFAAVLDSLSHPAQIVVQGRRLDVAPYTAMLRGNAAHLPDPGLGEAARAHADFLDGLGRHCDLTQRRVLVVVTARTGGEQRAPVLHIAEQVVTQLEGIGIAARRCTGEEVRWLLAEAMEPYRDAPPHPGTEN
ncbi:PrgI family protein [Streptomonospora nanhaiensis]|uniref:PrgI family protein n=1 Tax=Streptomonospora nanhaiensis TaxID=1323731 RepID=UPI001C3854EF|nr:PrgI family protein [Streptomonospora nanhaiensis]MBV2366235.1 PrgI family protein [Streptomonospora nanhaiensis]